MTIDRQSTNRWQAVLDRDASADGNFVYAVRSTGIYCRPTCPSRRPKQSEVSFFDTSRDAERDGFRACLRCKPRESQDSNLARIETVCLEIEQHSDEPLDLPKLAKSVDLSPSHLSRWFKRILGISPADYHQAIRMDHLKRQLRNGRSVTAALHEAGFSGSSRLYERSNQTIGMTPAIYKHGGQGIDIAFTTFRCDLGWILIATTQKGICQISMGESNQELETYLREEFHDATIHQDDRRLGVVKQIVHDCTAGIASPLTRRLRLDVRATAFQQRVWKELQKIPAGSTQSYAQIAAAIGQPQAVRAVARACATNPTAILVPCHRVVRSDGSLSGYRWGVERKRRLLERENANQRKITAAS